MNVLGVYVMGGLINWDDYMRGVFWRDDVSPMIPPLPGAIEALAMLRSRVFLPSDIYFIMKGDDTPETRRRLALWMAHNKVRGRTGITPLGSNLVFTSDGQGQTARALYDRDVTHVVGRRFAFEELTLSTLCRVYQLGAAESADRLAAGADVRVCTSWSEIEADLLPCAREFAPGNPPGADLSYGAPEAMA